MIMIESKLSQNSSMWKKKIHSFLFYNEDLQDTFHFFSVHINYSM